MMKNFHQFHMINPSPWPIINALISWNMASCMLWSMKSNMDTEVLLSCLMILISAFSWWKNITTETSSQGSHYYSITKGLKMGMMLFITSEAMFFLSFFWAYFHSSISPSMEMGLNWPPNKISTFNPMNVPLLNTIILVSSGVSVTWAHNEMMKKNMKNSNMSFMMTCALGLYFTTLQIMEYTQAEFCISDSSYGSTFFVTTGFHGLHVIIGTMFLTYSLLRTIKTKSNTYRILGMEMAAWYWHFVDVVWLFLYLSIYWWSY